MKPPKTKLRLLIIDDDTEVVEMLEEHFSDIDNVEVIQFFHLGFYNAIELNYYSQNLHKQMIVLIQKLLKEL